MTLRRLASVCVLAGVLSPALAAADPAVPADVDAAREHYRRGVQLYEAKKYEEALGELERANSLAPTYRLLYNIALVQRQLGDAAGAIRSFRSYLDAGAEVPAGRRVEVERAITELTAKVATVTVTTNVAGADVLVDDGVVGKTPLGPLRLNAGPHRLGATKPGYRPATRAIDVVGGDRLELPFALEELPPPEPPPIEPPAPPPPASPVEPEVVAPPPPPPVPAPLPEPPSRRAAPTWIGWSATGVLGAGALATGIAALEASRSLRSDVDDHATPSSTIHAAHQSTVTLAAVSDVLTGATLVAAGITVYWVVSHGRSTASSVRADLVAGPGSLWLSTTF